MRYSYYWFSFLVFSFFGSNTAIFAQFEKGPVSGPDAVEPVSIEGTVAVPAATNGSIGDVSSLANPLNVFGIVSEPAKEIKGSPSPVSEKIPANAPFKSKKPVEKSVERTLAKVRRTLASSKNEPQVNREGVSRLMDGAKISSNGNGGVVIPAQAPTIFRSFKPAEMFPLMDGASVILIGVTADEQSMFRFRHDGKLNSPTRWQILVDSKAINHFRGRRQKQAVREILENKNWPSERRLNAEELGDLRLAILDFMAKLPIEMRMKSFMKFGVFLKRLSHSLEWAEPASIPRWLNKETLRIDAKETYALGGGGLELVLIDESNQVEFNVPNRMARDHGVKPTVAFKSWDGQDIRFFEVDDPRHFTPGELRELISRVSIQNIGLDNPTIKAIQDFFESLSRPKP